MNTSTKPLPPMPTLAEIRSFSTVEVANRRRALMEQKMTTDPAYLALPRQYQERVRNSYVQA